MIFMAIPTLCPVFGTVVFPNNLPATPIRVVARLSKKYNYDETQVFMPSAETMTDENGEWSLELVESVSYLAAYTFEFYSGVDLLIKYEGVVVPNTTVLTAFSSLVSV